jgi:hypothetical protein
MSDDGTTGTSTGGSLAPDTAVPTSITASAVSSFGFPGRAVQQGSRGTKMYYGPGLVGTNRQILTDPNTGQPLTYNPKVDAPAVYSQMSPANRAVVLQVLYQKGLHPSTPGKFDSDVSAFQNLLEYASAGGITMERALNELQQNVPDYNKSGRGGGGVTARVTSPEDLKAVAKQVAQNTLGRSFTDVEANQFVAAYQSQEKAYQNTAGGVAVQTPGADVAAQSFAQQVAPTEAQGYKYLGYMNKLFDAIGSM